ncbi:Hypothetical protein CINCED_3A011900 [Cinara cedri]|uniref:Uncharacterized protein n=1 Tax=Cinara cedri TaxID=506608 RepID=A0A5E4NAT3_9HEMI|nr:Hypothetical protein CINCED_3A011900 [Cinara cedri]
MKKITSGTSNEIMSKLVWIESSVTNFARPNTMIVNKMTTENNDAWEDSDEEISEEIIMVDKSTMMPDFSSSHTINSGVAETSRRSTRDSGGPSNVSDSPRRSNSESDRTAILSDTARHLTKDSGGLSGVSGSPRRSNSESDRTAILSDTARHLIKDSGGLAGVPGSPRHSSSESDRRNKSYRTAISSDTTRPLIRESSQKNYSPKRSINHIFRPPRVIQEKKNPVCKNVGQTVPVMKIVECTKHLMAVIEQLMVDMPPTNKHYNAVIGLLNKVQWLLKDLGQTSGSSDQSQILMENYDNYRKAYCCLRNHIACTKQLSEQREITRQPREVNVDEAEQMPSSEGYSNGSNISVDVFHIIVMKNSKIKRNISRRLYKCPGMMNLDIFENRDAKHPDEPTRFVKDDKKRDNWPISLLRNACTFCFPFCYVK